MPSEDKRQKSDKMTFSITPQGEKIMNMLEDGTFSWERIEEMVKNGEFK